MGSQAQPGDDARDHAVFQPEDITSLDFPVGMRGFDRDAVRRALWRIASDYKAVLRQRDHSMAAAAESGSRASVAEAELQASARDVAALTKSNSELRRDLDTAQTWIGELEAAAADRTEDGAGTVDAGELARALERVTELETALERASGLEAEVGRVAELEAEVRQLDEARRRAEAAAAEAVAEAGRATAESSRAAAEASAALEASVAAQASAAAAAAAPPPQERRSDELLIAAMRAADALRTAARDEAQRTLKKARERGDELAHQADRQAKALAKAKDETDRLRASAERATAELERARAAQSEAEREAASVKKRMQAEVEQTVASLEAQKERVQTVLGNALTEALAALEMGGGDTTGLLDDLGARLGSKPGDGPA